MSILDNNVGRMATKPVFSEFKALVKPCVVGGVMCILQAPTHLSAQELRIGATQVVPEVRFDYVSTDNAFYTAQDPLEATGFLLSPSIKWQADKRLVNVTASYNGSFGGFSESALDYDDHDLSFRLEVAPGSRHRVFGEFLVQKNHEPLGTGQATFVVGVTDQVVSSNATLNVGYTFGASSAKGNVGGGLSIGTETYNDVPSVTEGDDNSEITPFLFFSYRVSPDTRFVTEVRFRLTDYDEDLRDRTEIRLLAGVDLLATARTGGSIRFGVSQANFDTVGVADTSSVISNINVYFSPRAYSRFNLLFTRSFLTVDNDASGPGASLVNTGLLTWTHDWSSRFSTVAKLGLQQVERNCPNNDSGNNSAGLELNVSVNRWLTIGPSVGFVSRTTGLCDTSSFTADQFEADKTVIGIHAVGTL